MKESKSSYSLSHYFDLLNRKEQPITRQIREISPPREEFSTGLNILKALKTATDQKLNLMGLSRALGLKIGACQQIAERLQEEGLIDIEADQDTGNDNILLTRKGMELL